MLQAKRHHVIPILRILPKRRHHFNHRTPRKHVQRNNHLRTVRCHEDLRTDHGSDNLIDTQLLQPHRFKLNLPITPSILLLPATRIDLAANQPPSSHSQELGSSLEESTCSAHSISPQEMHARTHIPPPASFQQRRGFRRSSHRRRLPSCEGKAGFDGEETGTIHRSQTFFCRGNDASFRNRSFGRVVSGKRESMERRRKEVSEERSAFRPPRRRSWSS